MSPTRRQLVSSGIASALGLSVLAGLRNHVDAEPQAGSSRDPALPLRVQVVIYDGFAVTDALAPFEVWKLARKLGGAIQTTLVSATGAPSVTALHDVIVKPTASFDADADMLVVPGAAERWPTGGFPEGLEAAMRLFRGPDKLLATVCTGAVFAARAGHLSSRHATTHRSAHAILEQQGALLVPARVVDDGDLISAAGVTSGIDLALYGVERFLGSALAIQVEQAMEYERRGTPWRR